MRHGAARRLSTSHPNQRRPRVEIRRMCELSTLVTGDVGDSLDGLGACRHCSHLATLRGRLHRGSCRTWQSLSVGELWPKVSSVSIPRGLEPSRRRRPRQRQAPQSRRVPRNRPPLAHVRSTSSKCNRCEQILRQSPRFRPRQTQDSFKHARVVATGDTVDIETAADCDGMHLRNARRRRFYVARQPRSVGSA